MQMAHGRCAAEGTCSFSPTETPLGRLFLRADPSDDARPVEDVRQRLSHVLWIGGGPCVGKTTLARLLAGKYDLKIYNLDWHLVREHRSRMGAIPGAISDGWDDLSMDDRWLLPTPQVMAEREIASWTARFQLVVEDLLALPGGRAIVAEGPSAFPWSVAKMIASSHQAIFLLPTREFTAAVLSRRNRDGAGAAHTSEPEQARQNIHERNELMAARIRASCDELGLRYERIDGSRDIDDALGLFEEHFRPHLPSGLNV